MNIKLAVLGYLNWKSFSGYDLKKVFSNSAYFYWSGNSNQIYKTLLDLQKSGLVSCKELKQDNYPVRKVYSITRSGRKELKEWIRSAPQLPQIRNSFLTQIAWADMLSDKELAELLDQYEYELDMQLVMLKENTRRGGDIPQRTERETLLWNMLAKNCSDSYERELAWVRDLRYKLNAL